MLSLAPQWVANSKVGKSSQMPWKQLLLTVCAATSEHPRIRRTYGWVHLRKTYRDGIYSGKSVDYIMSDDLTCAIKT